MGRLAYNRCYLAGGMDRVKDGGVGWRQSITPFLQRRKVMVLDPCNKPIDIGLEDDDNRAARRVAKQAERYDELAAHKMIRYVDLRMVDNSDFIIVHLDLDIHPCGTYEELFWSNREKRPIIVHMQQTKKNAPDWLFWTIPHEMIFSSWDEVKEYIRHIDEDDINTINHHKRWMFFNWEALYKGVNDG